MVAKTSILGNLRSLDYRFKQARSAKEELFCAKLAILELCGWIEETMDGMVRGCATKHLKNQANRDFCNTEIIKKTHGFDYQSNFRMMLIRLIGLIAVEKLERKVNPGTYASMTGTLSALKTSRNAEAHTHLKGIARTLNAPSVTIGQFHIIYAGLIEFEKKLKRMNL